MRERFETNLGIVASDGVREYAPAVEPTDPPGEAVVLRRTIFHRGSQFTPLRARSGAFRGIVRLRRDARRSRA